LRRPSVASTGSATPTTYRSRSCAIAVCPYGERPCHWNWRTSLVGTDEATARQRLLEGIRSQGRAKPSSPPPFPSSVVATAPPFPGSAVQSNLSLELVQAKRYSRTFLLHLPSGDHELQVRVAPFTGVPVFVVLLQAALLGLYISLDGKDQVKRALLPADTDHLLNFKAGLSIFMVEGSRKIPITIEVQAKYSGLYRVRVTSGRQLLYDDTKPNE
jgi:hypothetical protein